jgi:hypothetical protein
MAGSKEGLFARAQRAEQRGNRDVRDLWDRYQGHRARVTAEILALAPDGGRLCLLGAGNANDLDLDALAGRFGEIHLVDIDPGALARAINRQTPAVRARLQAHAPVDLSGLYQQLDHARLPPVDTLIEAGTTAVRRQLPDADLVVSCCVLSQMAWALEELAGHAPQPISLLQQALLRIHLRTLLATAPVALLVADLVSSSAYPPLGDLTPADDLGPLLQKLADERVAYPVCNPDFIRLTLRRDPALAAVAPPRPGPPWLWSGPNGLTYLVYPMIVRRGGVFPGGAP